VREAEEGPEVFMAKLKKLLAGIVFLILLCGAFIAGGFVGFINGYSYRVFEASVDNSYFSVKTLEMLDAGDVSGAKTQLETELDSQIVEHWSGVINKPLNFGMRPQNDKATNEIMAKVASYRKTNPHQAQDAKVLEAVESVVSRYKK
jgi:hypothetical protein